MLPSIGFYPLPFDREALSRERASIKIRGDVHNIGPVVTAGFPSVLSAISSPLPLGEDGRRPGEGSVTVDSGIASRTSNGSLTLTLSQRERGPSNAVLTRTNLANWLTDPRHSLTARVWVNRLWQWHFGTGIVATSDDFGIRGAKPTHPELLDWLASELIDSGWSTKHLQRLIVTSRAYRASSVAESLRDSDSNASHGVTRLHGFPRRRVEAEVLRDVQLSVAGLLERRIGGPSVGGPGESLDVREKSNRRNLYLFQKRGQPPSMQALFDGPVESSESCPVRHVSTTPLSALFLLNNEFAIRCGLQLAERIESLTGSDRERQIDTLFHEVLSRPPTKTERLAIHQFFDEEAAKRSGSSTKSNNPTPLQILCHLMLSLNELSSLE